jgi:hypothetical protein
LDDFLGISEMLRTTSKAGFAFSEGIEINIEDFHNFIRNFTE